MTIGEVSTAYDCSFLCECGGTVEAHGEVPGAHKVVTLSSIECDGCDATYTVEIATKETTND